jgi:hypothetical protein
MWEKIEKEKDLKGLSNLGSSARRQSLLFPFLPDLAFPSQRTNLSVAGGRGRSRCGSRTKDLSSPFSSSLTLNLETKQYTRESLLEFHSIGTQHLTEWSAVSEETKSIVYDKFVQGIRFPCTSFVPLSPLSSLSFRSFFRYCRPSFLAGAHHRETPSRSGQDIEMEK